MADFDRSEAIVGAVNWYMRCALLLLVMFHGGDALGASADRPGNAAVQLGVAQSATGTSGSGASTDRSGRWSRALDAEDPHGLDPGPARDTRSRFHATQREKRADKGSNRHPLNFLWRVAPTPDNGNEWAFFIRQTGLEGRAADVVKAMAWDILRIGSYGSVQSASWEPGSPLAGFEADLSARADEFFRLVKRPQRLRVYKVLGKISWAQRKAHALWLSGVREFAEGDLAAWQEDKGNGDGEYLRSFAIHLGKGPEEMRMIREDLVQAVRFLLARYCHCWSCPSATVMSEPELEREYGECNRRERELLESTGLYAF